MILCHIREAGVGPRSQPSLESQPLWGLLLSHMSQPAEQHLFLFLCALLHVSDLLLQQPHVAPRARWQGHTYHAEQPLGRWTHTQALCNGYMLLFQKAALVMQEARGQNGESAGWLSVVLVCAGVKGTSHHRLEGVGVSQELCVAP